MLPNTLRSIPIDWDLWEVNDQTISSMDTSINNAKIPALFSIVDKKIGWKSHTINFDIGGGKYDNVCDYMADRCVAHLIYDPFNRSKAHNIQSITAAVYYGAYTVTISNVLNVIKERKVRIYILTQASYVLKTNGTVYIKVYEGDGTGRGKRTTKGWQNNMPTKSYLSEVKKVFPKAYIKYGLIIAIK
jgi:hypothetical protein